MTIRSRGYLAVALQKLRQRHLARHNRKRQSGAALLLTISSLALLTALLSEFTFTTSIHRAQAVNGRDELRAHYMAKAAFSLSRLLIKIQQRFVEPFMGQARQMLDGAGGGALPISLRVTDYAGTLMSFFGGDDMAREGLGSLVGLDLTEAKGLGMSAGTLDASISVEDGKIDINCGSGLVATRPRQVSLFRMLASLVYSRTYDNIFEEAQSDGQFYDRLNIAQAIIDWADGDELAFSLDANQGGVEDYRYNAGPVKYRAHNNSYDTLEEVGMVFGMKGMMLDAFLPHLTVYATDPERKCRVNLGFVGKACTPLLVGLLRAAAIPDPAQPPENPAILDDTRIYPLASILCERGASVGFDSLDTILGVIQEPQTSIHREDPRFELMQSLQGLEIKKADLEKFAYVGNARVYRIEATGEVGRVRKKITAIIDTQRSLANPLTINPIAEKEAGVLQYWREQ